MRLSSFMLLFLAPFFGLAQNPCTQYLQLIEEGMAAWRADPIDFETALKKLDEALVDCPRKDYSIEYTIKQVKEAQKLYSANTIYDVFENLSGACAVDETLFEKPGPRKENSPKSLDTSPPMISDSQIADLQEAVANNFKSAVKLPNAKKNELTKTLKGGSILYCKNQKWGLRDLSGKEILPPTFDHVLVDEYFNGFVGYIGDLCNYYEKGRKVFPEDYYFIQRIKNRNWILQQASGFGVLDDVSKEFILEPVYHNIETRAYDDIEGILFRIEEYTRLGYYTTQNFNFKLPFRGRFEDVELLSDNYIFYKKDIVNTNKKSKLLCGANLTIDVVSKKYQLAIISKYPGNKRYWMDFDGNLLFKDLKILSRVINDHYLMASRLSDEKKRGIWNLSSQDWLIPPTHSTLNMTPANSIILADAAGKIGVISLNGKTILPYKYKSISTIEMLETDELAYVVKDEYNKTSILKAKDLEVVRKNLDFDRIGKIVGYGECNGGFYSVEIGNYNNLLDKNFNRVLPDSLPVLFFQSGGIVGAKAEGKLYNYFDCYGHRLKYTINGRVVESFRNVKNTNSKYYLVELESRQKFMISKDGQVIIEKADLFPFKTLDFGNFGFTILTRKAQKYDDGPFHLLDQIENEIFPWGIKGIEEYNPKYEAARIRLDHYQEGIFTKEGKVTNIQNVSTIYGTQHLGFDLYRAGRSGIRGVVNFYNEIIVPLKFDSVSIVGGIIYANDQRFTLSGKSINDN